MKIIGITGPTGAGKTTALNVLRDMGAEVLDADAVYHRLLEESPPLRESLAAAFGAGILDGEGRVDRKKLSAVVYPDRLEELNALTHPAVAEEIFRLADQARARGSIAVAIDAIALVESGMAAWCDIVVAVLAPLEVRIRRIMARDGINEAYARRRALAQKDEAFFRSHAGYVLENRGSDTAETFGERAEALFRELLGRR